MGVSYNKLVKFSIPVVDLNRHLGWFTAPTMRAAKSTRSIVSGARALQYVLTK